MIRRIYYSCATSACIYNMCLSVLAWTYPEVGLLKRTFCHESVDCRESTTEQWNSGSFPLLMLPPYIHVFCFVFVWLYSHKWYTVFQEKTFVLCYWVKKLTEGLSKPYDHDKYWGAVPEWKYFGLKPENLHIYVTLYSIINVRLQFQQQREEQVSIRMQKEKRNCHFIHIHCTHHPFKLILWTGRAPFLKVSPLAIEPL